MARRFALNPSGVEDAYLHGLQESFPGWGGRADFAWWFRREVDALPADLLTLSDGDALIAGLALSYRRFDPGDGAESSLVAILSGAWTRPEHRRRGCFAALLEHAGPVAARRDAAALIGFVSRGRASMPILEAAASERIKSWQLRAGGRLAGEAQAPAVQRSAPDEEALQRWFHENRACGGFVYRTAGVFADQARLRRASATVVGVADGHWVIVDGERVHAVVHESAPLEADGTAAALACAARGRPGLLAYTTRRELAEAAERAGFEADEAQVIVIAVAGRPTALLRIGEAWLQELDRA